MSIVSDLRAYKESSDVEPEDMAQYLINLLKLRPEAFTEEVAFAEAEKKPTARRGRKPKASAEDVSSSQDSTQPEKPAGDAPKAATKPKIDKAAQQETK